MLLLVLLLCLLLIIVFDVSQAWASLATVNLRTEILDLIRDSLMIRPFGDSHNNHNNNNSNNEPNNDNDNNDDDNNTNVIIAIAESQI